MKKKILRLFYRSFEESLSEKEALILSESLAKSDELRQEKMEIEQMRSALAMQGQNQFKPFFAERVMRKISNLNAKDVKQEMFFESLVGYFRKVIITGVAATIILFSCQMLKSNQTLNDIDKVQQSEMTIDDALISTYTTSLEDVL